ncbi:MAG: hypothetical protein IJR49_02890, partial [Treponema sp.]|nr:hypothetical protein [Treponema sp.]
VISIMNAQTILDNDDSSNISNADSTTDFSSSTFTDEESNLVDAAELAEEDFKNFIQEEEAMNTTDAGVRAQEIVSQEARSLDSSYEPVALDELELLSAESEILSQNIHSTGELPNSEEAVLPSNVDALTQHRIADSAERYECIELEGHSRSGKNTLHVFAESLVFGKTEVPHFSKALVQCCKRIAKIRNYSHIHLYYGLPLENDEFAQMLRHFIDDHSVIYACMAENTNSLSETAKKFIEISGISLEKNLVEGANEMAKNDSIAFPKMILQDDYSE